jgi:hypothetical protein
MSAGIDYGLGRTNINHVTGIRYGVIAQGSVLQAWADSSEPDYGPATCPKCGNEALEYNEEKHKAFEHSSSGACADYACETCEIYFEACEAFGEEALAWNYAGDGYECSSAFDNTEIFVTASPFYTFAQFCSPCAPGAGNLDSPIEDGAKTYCFGHDWFEEGRAPYPVFSVETGQEILPDSK